MISLLEQYTIISKSRHGSNRRQRDDVDVISAERLNTFYIRKKCRISLIFRLDMVEHQRSTGHARIVEIAFDEAY
jgi:hypothetical protein